MSIWEGSQIVEDRDGATNGVRNRFYVAGFQQVSGANPGKHFYSKDHLGSVRELTGATGNVESRFDYSPSGTREELLGGGVGAKVGYANNQTLEEFDLVMTQHRAYDSEAGRWLSREPLGEGFDQTLYSYVGNSPLNFVDVTGLASQIPPGPRALDPSNDNGGRSPKTDESSESRSNRSNDGGRRSVGSNPARDMFTGYGMANLGGFLFIFGVGTAAFGIYALSRGQLFVGGIALIGGIALAATGLVLLIEGFGRMIVAQGRLGTLNFFRRGCP